MSTSLSPQMFALLDAIVTGNGAEAFEPFAPQNTVAALVRRGLLSEERISRRTAAPGYEAMMASIGCVRLLPTPAGRKVIADAEAAVEAAGGVRTKREG